MKIEGYVHIIIRQDIVTERRNPIAVYHDEEIANIALNEWKISTNSDIFELQKWEVM